MRSRSYAIKRKLRLLLHKFKLSPKTKLKGVAFLPNKNTTCLEMILNLCSNDSLSQYKNFINSLFKTKKVVPRLRRQARNHHQHYCSTAHFYPNFYLRLLYHPPLPLAMVPPPFSFHEKRGIIFALLLFY